MEKNTIIFIEKEKAKKLKMLNHLRNQEQKTIAKWKTKFNDYNRAVTEFVNLKRKGTKKEQKLRNTIQIWQNLSEELTRERDRIRELIKEMENIIHGADYTLSAMLTELKKDTEYNDEMIDQFFSLTEKVNEALRARELYSSKHVFDKLVDSDGKPRTQLTFLNSDGTRKLVVRVNTLNFVDHNHAVEAKAEIEKFFTRFESDSESSEAVRLMFSLTKKLLTEKTTFRIGETLYQFLSMKVDENLFPELKKAQKLLRSGLRSEKSSSYIRLYEKDNRGKFLPVKTG